MCSSIGGHCKPMPQHWCSNPSPKGSPRSVGEATKNYAREVSFPGAISISLHQRLHAQHRVTLLGQPVQQLLAVGGDGLVSYHVGEVVDAVQFLGRLVQTLGNVVLQLLGHPDNALDAALSSDELLGGDEVTAVTHVAGGLDTAAGAGGQLAEGHTGRGHALVFPVDNDEAVGHGLNAADALKAAAGGHGILQDGVQGDIFHSAVGRVGDRLVDGGEAAGALVLARALDNGLAGTVGVQLVGSLGIQPGHGAAQTQTLGSDHAAVGGGEGLAHDAGEVAVNGLIGHGRQTVVTLVVPGHSHLVAELLRLGGVGNQGDLALVHNGVELVHDHDVQNLGEVLQPQTGVVGRVADTDTNLVALAGVHNAFHVVEPGVDLPLDNGLEVHLHLRAGHLNIGRQSQILGRDRSRGRRW